MFTSESPRSPSREIDPPPDSYEDDVGPGVLAGFASQLREFVEWVLQRTSAAFSGFLAGWAKIRIPGWLACTLILLVIGFVVWIRAERNVPVSKREVKSSAPAPTRGLGLVNSVELDHIRIGWNPHAPAVARATSGTLSVTDGTAHHTISLDRNVLANGSVAYYPTSDMAAFELRIGDITESLVAVGLDRAINARPAPAQIADDQKGIPRPLEEIPPSAGSTTETPSNQSSSQTPLRVREQRLPVLARDSEKVPSKPEAAPIIQPAAPAPEPPQTRDAGIARDTPFGVTAPPSASTSLPPPAPHPSRAETAAARRNKGKDTLAAQPIKRVFPQASGNSLKSLVGSVTIQVQVYIDSQGKVVRAAALSHGGTLIEDLSNLSVNAAREWVFAPARRKGRDVESNTVLDFVFDNKGVEKPSEN